MLESKEGRRALLLIGVGLLLAGGGWLLHRGGSEGGARIEAERSSAESADADEREPGADLKGEAEASTSDEGTAGAWVPGEGARVAHAAPDLALEVSDSQGAPVEGVRAQWSALPGPDGLLASDGLRARAASIEERSVLASSDARGRIEFDRRPVGLEGKSVLWLTHPEHLALCLEPRDSAGERLVLKLESKAGARLRVVDRSGAPVGGAEVVAVGVPLEEVALESRALRISGAAPLADLLARSFCWRGTSDEGGELAFPPLDRPALVQAFAGELRSVPRLAPAPGEALELELAAGSRVSGSVRLEDGSPLPAEVRIALLEYRAEARERRQVGWIPVRPDGRFGPLSFPSTSAPELVVRLEGGKLVAVEETRPMPQPGEELSVDFLTRPGGTLEVRVVADESGLPPIQGARVSFLWIEGEAWGRAVAWSDEQGLAAVECCQHTTGLVRAEASGFATETKSNVLLPYEGELRIELRRAAGLHGRCTSAGLPVRDFEVHYWLDGSAHRESRRFSGREGGDFAIEGVPEGELLVLAHSDLHVECDPVRVSVKLGEPAEVELELPAPRRGIGRVVDVETMEPISDAKVQAVFALASTGLGRRGREHPVDSAGRFDLEIFGDKECTVLASAPGYDAEAERGAPGPDEVLDFGVIALGRRQTLEVRVRGPELRDASHLWFGATGNQSIPTTRFPPEGVLRFDSISSGEYFCTFLWPDGSFVQQIAWLVPGKPWVVDYVLGAQRKLVIEAVPEAGGADLEGKGVQLDFRRGDTLLSSFITSLEAQGRVEIDQVEGDEVWGILIGEDRRLLGIAHRKLEEGTTHLRIPFRARRVEVEVRDAAGRALAEAEVWFGARQGERAWRIQRITDARGIARIDGMSIDRMDFFAYHRRQGSAWLEGVLLSSEPVQRFELVLGEGSEPVLELRDGETPIAGARVYLYPPGSRHFLSARCTDAHGRARFSRVAEGEYDVRVNHQGLWPLFRRVRIGGAPGPERLDVLRLGALRVQVRSPLGAARPGIGVAIHSVALDEPVARWIALGLIRAAPTGLSTDSLGELALEGLPRGEYEISVVLESGEVIRERATVPAAGEGRAELLLR